MLSAMRIALALLAVALSGPVPARAQAAVRAQAQVHCDVPTRVVATLRVATSQPILTRAPRRELGVLGKGLPAVAIPDTWTWALEPIAPDQLDADGLRTLCAAAAFAPALSLAHCTQLRDQDLRALAPLRHLRQLDLSGCTGLTAAAWSTLRELPALEWLRLDGTALEHADAPAFGKLRHAALEARIHQAIANQQLIGLAVAVVADGRIVYARGFGLADRSEQQPVRAGGTSFRWASISKPVTAIAALQLAEQGKLDLDADVRTLVPEFPAKPFPITARQLLTDQGGIVHYTNGEVIRTERSYDTPHPFHDVVTALDTFKESPLVCEPGTKHSYTTHGYILLGAVVQRAGGASYWQQVRERIATPLGMTTFVPDYPGPTPAPRTRGYRKPLGVVVPSADADVAWKLPGGGFTSTVVDLARFAQGLLDGSLLSEATQTSMCTAQTTRDGQRTKYGLGIGVGRVDGQPAISHSGAQDQTRTNLVIVPGKQIAVAVMCNSEWAKLDAFTDELVKLVR